MTLREGYLLPQMGMNVTVYRFLPFNEMLIVKLLNLKWCQVDAIISTLHHFFLKLSLKSVTAVTAATTA